ncbi:sodium:proton antiporter [Gordonia sp. TBRC 11910]|uniref:Sodium:proton antiporter n=1 Tax=Gordonia asplenii TaxID=2725283 RepID=A0A848KYJ4_9ACTN|nr:cation:proton antiporter [Gordonia asplenii]NMO03207.1 sodium:proton antiporter [Gordonia asplenii]
MILLLVTAPALLWAVTEKKLRAYSVTGPILMTALGATIGSLSSDTAEGFNSHTALTVAEIILALLLFTDAIDVRGSLRSHLQPVPVRLLAIALPLSLILVLAVGLMLPFQLSAAAVLAIACIAIPADFSPETSLVRNRLIPERVRSWLAIESGYNDGLVTPLLLASLALSATSPDKGTQVVTAFLDAAPAGVIAVGVGAAVGSLLGLLFRTALRHEWAGSQSIRIGILVVPVFTFAVAVAVHGNGFVAAFVCGIAFRIALGEFDDAADHFRLTEDVTEFVNLLLWLAFGVAAVTLIGNSFSWWPAAVLAIFALTIGRALPVAVALIGTDTSRRDRLFMALMGPRGAASIVFGLIAYNSLPKHDGYPVLVATCFVVLGSLLLHGVAATWLTPRVYRR